MYTPLTLLEHLRSQPSEARWKELCELYEPLIRRWLLCDPSLRDEADDLLQEVLTTVSQELAQFTRLRDGSFRHWLRNVTMNRLRAFWRARQRRPVPLNAGPDDSQLVQLEDPHSELSRRWDEEHNQHVIQHLMKRAQARFSSAVWQAFSRVTIEGQEPDRVAADLGTTVEAVYTAKYRVLKHLRQEGGDLLD